VHARNRAGNTPLFLAKKTGRVEHCGILEEAGGHLHVEERAWIA
jgi:lysophospholipase